MSTYEIREALEALKTRAHAEGNGLLMEQYTRATLQVEAIERAAKSLARFYGGKERTDSERALSLMESIAKDTP